MLLKVSNLLTELVTHYLQIGNRVWRFKDAENACASWRVGSPGVDDLKDHLEGTTTFIPPLPSTRSHHWGFFLHAKKGCCSFILDINYAHWIQKVGRFLPLVLIQQSMNLAPQGRDIHIWCYTNFLSSSTPILQWKRKNTLLSNKIIPHKLLCSGTHLSFTGKGYTPFAKPPISRYVSVLTILILHPTVFTFGPLTALSRGC